MRVAGLSHARLHLSLVLDTGVCHSHRSNTAFDREAETPGRRRSLYDSGDKHLRNHTGDTVVVLVGGCLIQNRTS